MSGQLVASLVLKLNDQGSGPAARALQTVTRALKETEGAAKSTSQSALSAWQKMASARELLGIRSEKAIQNEIRQTEAAYQRLANAGTASSRELARAQEAMRQKVSELRRELDGVKTSAGGAGSALQRAIGIVGAYQAGKMVLQGPISRTMDYGMELAHTSNTLFAGRSVAERIAGKQQINDAVMAGVREAKGGVSREDALAGVKTIGASGEYGEDPQAAFALLPTVTKAAAANNASVTDMANIAIKAKQTMGLTNAARVLDMAAQGGIEGAFELRDMAKWLPQQMAYAQRTGLHGDAGFATLVAANQISMRTAGSADEAGNNLKNLLAKVNSADTANDAKKLGIDLSGSLAAAQAKGVGGLDAFLNLTEQVAAKDQRLVALREKAKTAKGDDLRANLAAQQGILEGSSIGKIVQDQQAMAALVALLNGRGRLNEIRDKALSANGTNDDLLKLIESEPAAKAQLAAAEAANNMQTALNRVNPLLGTAADWYSKLSQDFPVLTAALSGTTLGVTALGGAALAAAGSVALLGGGAGAGGGAAMAAGGKMLGRMGAVGLSLGAGVAVGAVANSGINAAVSKLTGRDETLGGLIYDMTHGDALKNNSSTRAVFSDPSELTQALQARRAKSEWLETPSDAKPQVIQLQVDGRTLAEVVNDHNARQAARN